MRFLGTALLVVGIAYLLLGGIARGPAGGVREFPVGTLLLVVLIWRQLQMRRQRRAVI